MSQQINLFNPILLRQKKYFSALAMLQALGLVVLGALLIAAYAAYRSSTLQDEVDRTSSQLRQAQAQQIRVNAEFGPRAPNALLADELKKSSADVNSLRQVFDILQTGEFGNTDGYSEYLRAFSRQITDGLWLTGFAIYGAGNEIALQGRAVQPDLVPLYVSRLTHEPVMRGKSFSELTMQQPKAEVNPAAGTAADANAPMLAPGYIEFKLQSAGAAKDAVADAGERK